MGKYACVKSAHQYAIEVAPPEVRPALEWLNASGYVVRSENGGPAEGDEGFLVEWERPPIVVRVVRQDAHAVTRPEPMSSAYHRSNAAPTVTKSAAS